ncbi:MAG: hypothetical protein IPK52_04365 [Chloroflexi bacterium]|nr:hypothetical protein [Chloroflexota bacterium]
MNDNNSANMTTLAETENYVAWQGVEPDGEVTVHLEMGSVTFHFFPEEWEEFLSLVDEILDARAKKGKGRK